MEDSLFPTPHTDVNAVLREFQDRIQSILGAQFVGLYLYGSLALGDFDPRTSDIDFIVLTREEISDVALAALREMHAQFDRGDSPWAGKIEAAYIPLETLNQPAPTSTLYPQIEKGTELVRAPLEVGWAFQRHTLRECGAILIGPPPRSLIDPVAPDEMHRAATTILAGWQEQSLKDPSWVAWARQRRSQAFLILTVCRIRYSLETGAVASKAAAAHWAKATLGARWGMLIDRALTSPQDGQEVSDAELNETLAFLHDAVLLLS